MNDEYKLAFKEYVIALLCENKITEFTPTSVLAFVENKIANNDFPTFEIVYQQNNQMEAKERVDKLRSLCNFLNGITNSPYNHTIEKYVQLFQFPVFNEWIIENQEQEENNQMFYIGYFSSPHSHCKKSLLTVFGDWENLSYTTIKEDNSTYRDYGVAEECTRINGNTVLVATFAKDSIPKAVTMYISLMNAPERNYVSAIYTALSDDVAEMISGIIIFERTNAKTKNEAQALLSKEPPQEIAYELLNSRINYSKQVRRTLDSFDVHENLKTYNKFVGEYDVFVSNSLPEITICVMAIGKLFDVELESKDRAYKGNAYMKNGNNTLHCQLFFKKYDINIYIENPHIEKEYFFGTVAGLSHQNEPFASRILLYKLKNGEKPIKKEQLSTENAEKYAELLKKHPIMTDWLLGKKDEFLESYKSYYHLQEKGEALKIVHNNKIVK